VSNRRNAIVSTVVTNCTENEGFGAGIGISLANFALRGVALTTLYQGINRI
jgi:hypothetical protein